LATLGFDEIASNPEYGLLFVAIAVMVSSFTFLYPIYIQRKSALARGLSETIRILESNESHKARLVFYSKYEQNENINEDELEKSAEKIRNDLLLIQNMFDEKALPHKVFQIMYAKKLVKIINSYVQFMKEFYPSFEIEPEIRKLYKNSYKWHKLHSKDKFSKEFEGGLEDLWDKVGL